MATKSRAAKAKAGQTETRIQTPGLADRLEAMVDGINQQRAGHRKKEKAANNLRAEGHAVEPEREVIHLSKPDTLTFLTCDLRAGLLRANATASTISDLLFGESDRSGVEAGKQCVAGLSDLLVECAGLLNGLNTRLCLIEGRL